MIQHNTISCPCPACNRFRVKNQLNTSSFPDQERPKWGQPVEESNWMPRVSSTLVNSLGSMVRKY
jgi:hypothetical protein